MKIFKVSKKIEAVCDWKKTRIAFKHEATLIINGHEYETVKICYQNRTWERYKYQSVLEKLANESKCLSPKEKKLFLDKIENGFSQEADREVKKQFSNVGVIALLGDVFCDTDKQKNDWKARMIKAGLPGLAIPEDWDQLSEEEKTLRLDKVITELIK